MGYFGTIPSGILRNKTVSSSAKVLYAHITMYAEVNGDFHLNYFSLANQTGFNMPDIKHYLAELLDIKAIAKLTKTKISLNPFKKPTDQVAIDFDFVEVFIEKWNKVFKIECPTGIYKTDELVSAITAREKVFGKDKLLLAIENQYLSVHSNPWYAEKDHRALRGRPMILLKEDSRVEAALAHKGTKFATKEEPTDNKMLD